MAWTATGGAGMQNFMSSLQDLGLGDMLSQQQKDQTDEMRRRKKLGIDASGNAVLVGNNGSGYGRTGVASLDLGIGTSARGY